MPTVAEVFALAKDHHQAGRFAFAEQCYRQVLQANPSYVEAWCLLGSVCQAQGNLAAAENNFRQAIQLQPNLADAHANLANVFVYQQKYDEAIVQYQRALQLNPDLFGAHYILGIALHDKCRWDEAVHHFQQALRLNPQHAPVHHCLGNTFMAMGNLEEAAAWYRQTLLLDPNLADAWGNLGTVLSRQAKLHDARDCYQRCLQLNPNRAEVHCYLGMVLERLGMLEEAVRSHQQALRLKPDDVGTLHGLGNVLRQQNKPDDAARVYEQALRLKPHHAEGWTNLGNARREQGRFDEALACFENAIGQDPNLVGPRHNRALLWLLLGNWAQGWPEYEWRLQTPDFPRIPFQQPRWDGSSLEGKTLLVLAEQGLGDTLQFVRYLPLVQQRGGRVIVQCQRSVERVVGGYLSADHLVVEGAPLPAFDVYAPLLSLPGILGTTPTSIPADVPYLSADAASVEHWRRELAALGGFKIGIAWQGNPGHIGDRQRSIALTQFAPLAKVPGVQLISLQKGRGLEQLQTLAGQFPVHELGSRLHDFMDTAAVLKNLDLVIACDTALVHLAGALAVPVWVALPYIPDWRWLLEREDTTWYPTMRLFRQKRPGDWSEVFQRLAAEVQTKMAAGVSA